MLRVSDPELFEQPIVITNVAYRFLVREQLAEIGVQAHILLEPVKRDSGPAIAAGAAFAARRDPEAVVVALAADHVVDDDAAFVTACRQGLPAAQAGRIVTFGVRPEGPSVEYGYIKPAADAQDSVLPVERFVEKPDLETAKRYVSEGYLWNTGNFMFRAATLLEEYRAVDAGSVESVEAAIAKATADLDFCVLDRASFEAAKPISIDYAVMETTSRASVIAVSYGWSDVGSWLAIWQLSEKDRNGNTARGSALFENAHNCNVWSDKALIALQGVDDLVVVATQDAILVSRQNGGGSMKTLVSQLKTVAPKVTEDHISVHRPWGSYQSLDTGDRHQVKRIVVKPGERLSLQKHHHRSEHWIVVRGTAQVTVDDLVKTIHENESIYIPIGATHRLDNPGKITLELIEVQTGSYLGEDDIIRFDDDYRRT